MVLVVVLLRGTIVKRTYGTHTKNIYLRILLAIFGPIYYGPPSYCCLFMTPLMVLVRIENHRCGNTMVLLWPCCSMVPLYGSIHGTNMVLMQLY